MRSQELHDEHARRLRESLPYMDAPDADDSVFPRVIQKKEHPIRPFVAGGVIIIILIALFCMFSLARVDGHSMDYTFHNGEYVLLQRYQKPRRFDVVVLNEREKNNGPAKHIIKRVIGLPGDTIAVIQGNLYINNKRYAEPYLSSAHTKMYKELNWTVHVPKGHVFVLGDNRDISKDSRIVGSFKTSAIVGVKVLTFG